MNDYDRLAALERRGDALERFADCERQAHEWINKHGTQELVDQLQAARRDHRPMRIGTINTLVLLAHIDRLEAEVAKDALTHA